MIGAIVGDIAGSRFEWYQHKSKDFELLSQADGCKYTDDSVMTIAIADAILECNGDYSFLREKAIASMRRLGGQYPQVGYGSGFTAWLKTAEPKPYNSFGNGAAMRVSPCAYIAKNLEDAKKLSRAVTEVTHNHPEGLKGAEAVTVSVYLALQGKSIPEIRDYINKNYYPMNFSLDSIRNQYSVDVSCQGSVPQAIMAFLESADFDDAIRNAVSLGGDADTQAAIAGSIAEAYYGIPREIRSSAFSFLDDTLTSIVKKFEFKFGIKHYKGNENKDQSRRPADRQTERKATQVDEGWRTRTSAQADESGKSTAKSGRAATEVDEGWRAKSEGNKRQATQVDEGWRNGAKEGRAATEVDEGWRAKSDGNKRQATQVDEGWRNGAKEGRAATEVDEGWRAKSDGNKRQATQVDEGWRRNVADVIDPQNIMNSATANYFSTIDAFKDAVEKLTELRSSTGNIYKVKKTISRAGGESIILLCADPDGNNVVAKVYYEPVNGAGSSISSRSLVLEYMGTEEGKKYTLAVSEIGLVEFSKSRYYFEIMPYCENTDLSDDGAYSFERIVEITRQLNEGLHSIHQAGIIHRDIKPENLYDIDGQIKLGDFGIAKNGAMGHSHVTEHILGTEGYAAPETRRYIYNEKSDYYSLGVTLATLFEGHFVFENMNYEMQALAQESERLPLLRVDPNREQLENLLNGLCRLNSKQRFGYEEVKRWLADHNYTGGGADEEEWPKAYRLLGDVYRDEQSMFLGITKDEQHWEEAKNMLFSKIIEQFFISFRTDLARAAQIADEQYRAGNRDKGLAVFLKALYAPGPIVWKGYTFNSLSELGGKMVATKTPIAYSELLQNHCISHWLSKTEGINVDETTQKLVVEIEALSATEPAAACYWFGNSFAAKRNLQICSSKVSTVAELVYALFSSPGDFYLTDGYQKLMSRTDGADLYGFLFSFGYRTAIDKEWEHANHCDAFSKTAVLMAMMDTIAVKENIDPSIIRRFFVEYGPVGIATYTQKLAARTTDKVYMPLDADGVQTLSKIVGFKGPSGGSVDELLRAYMPLVDSIDKLRKILIDNPHCILTGVYENKGVICTNLIGCFAFRFFERIAPLGFQTLIETANGGVKQ